MLIVVTGKNNSGKSRFAEELALELGENRWYLATMIPFGQEGADRVRRHLAQRAGKGFTTLELPCQVGGAAIPPQGVALVEDASNLLANNLFETGRNRQDVLADLLTLAGRVRHTIVVTIGQMEEGAYSPETRQYMADLLWLNRQLACRAGAVVELTAGDAVVRKGTLP